MIDFDSILINGDSYSAALRRHPVYANHLGEMLGYEIFNHASIGSSNDRITRTTIEYVNRALKAGHAPLVIVAWSSVRRQEVWHYGDHDIKFSDPDLSKESKFITLDFLLSDGLATLEQRSMLMPLLHVHKTLMDFYTQMYLLANWLQSKGLHYLFFSAANNTDCPVDCFPAIHDLDQVQWCCQNPMIYRLHDFCIPLWAETHDSDRQQSTGHLSEQGHAEFAGFLHHLLGERIGYL